MTHLLRELINSALNEEPVASGAVAAEIHGSGLIDNTSAFSLRFQPTGANLRAGGNVQSVLHRRPAVAVRRSPTGV